MRDIELAIRLANLPDYSWVGPAEVAALTGLSIHTIQQRKIDLPPTDPRIHRMKWLLGDIRNWLSNRKFAVSLTESTKRIGKSKKTKTAF